MITKSLKRHKKPVYKREVAGARPVLLNTWIAEVLPGLDKVCADELRSALSPHVKRIKLDEPDEISFEYSDAPAKLLALTTVSSIFRLVSFPVERPRGIMDEVQLVKLVGAIESVKKLSTFKSFRISAAGSNSPAFHDITEKISAAVNLPYDHQDGELLLRFRRDKRNTCWEILVRISPRPLSVRSWRTENIPGAINPCIAASMVRLLDPTPRAPFLDLTCGTGTILVEKSRFVSKGPLIGTDCDPQMLRIAAANLKGMRGDKALFRSDAGTLPFAEKSIDYICSNLPWGELVGDRDSNAVFYESVLNEISRVAKSEARVALITQHSAPLRELLAVQHSQRWQCDEFKVFQGGFHPTIFILSPKPPRPKS